MKNHSRGLWPPLEDRFLNAYVPGFACMHGHGLHKATMLPEWAIGCEALPVLLVDGQVDVGLLRVAHEVALASHKGHQWSIRPFNVLPRTNQVGVRPISCRCVHCSSLLRLPSQLDAMNAEMPRLCNSIMS